MDSCAAFAHLLQIVSSATEALQIHLDRTNQYLTTKSKTKQNQD